MPIHVTTSTTQSLSGKTFVDRVSTTGVVYASSGNSNQWSSAYSSVYTTSASWDSTYTSLNTNSAKYDSVYTSVNTNSSKYDSTYTSLNTNSAKYDSVYTSLNTNSAKYDSTYTSLNTNSSKYDSTYTSLNTNSAKYDSVYTSVNTNSSKYDSTYTFLNTNSAKYDSAYTTTNTKSANWDSTYNTVYTASGSWAAQTLSFDENTAILSIANNGNFVSLSALSSSGGGGGGGITVETDPVFTTWAQANSGKYESTYTTVSATSGSYITNITSNTQGILSGIRLGNTFNVNTGLTVSATPTFDGLLVSNSVLTATKGVTINPSGAGDALVVNSNGLTRLYGGAQVNDYTLPEAVGDQPLPYSAIMKLNAYNASWERDLGESAYTTLRGISGNLILGQLGITIDGAGSPISTGIKQYLRVPYNCTITAAEVVADTAGYITVDIYNGTYANYPPTGSITGSAKPKLEDQLKNKFTSLAGSGWTTTLTAGDYLGFEVTYAGVTPNIKKITLTLSTSR